MRERKIIVYLIIGLFFGSSSTPLIINNVRADLTDGLAGYWNFNEGSGTVAHDSSGNGNDGTIYDATWTTGISDNALDFDGINDYVNCGNSNSLGIPGDFSVSAWINIDQNNNDDYLAIVCKGTDASTAGNGWYLWVYGNGFDDPNKINHVAIQSNAPGYSWDYMSGTTILQPGIWYHIVGVFNCDGSSRNSIFINSVQESIYYQSGSAISTREDSGSPVTIGYYGYPPAPSVTYFEGPIDEVRIYNRTLSQNEIQELYENSGSGYTLFSDDFNDENNDGWTVNQGDWSVVNGEYAYNYNGLTDTDGITSAGSSEWSDFTYTCKFRYTECSYLYPQIYFNFRFGDYSGYNLYNGYIFMYDPITQRWCLTKFYNSGNYSVISYESSTSFLNANQWYNVKIEVFGSHIKCFIDDILKIDVYDTTYITGKIGLRGDATKIFFDDVIVTTSEGGGGNAPPIANFTWTPTYPNPDQTVTFDASSSYDPDGSITFYEWDWNNDGLYYESNSTSIITHSWSQAGSYSVVLRVSDNNGANDTFTQIVKVSEPNQPPEWRNQGQNKSIIQPGSSISLFAQGKDDVALDRAWLATNETGQWQNFTESHNWYDTDWRYKKSVSIDNASTDYQMKITIGYVSGGNVSLGGKCKTDFGDIRFVNSLDTTELPYWLESKIDGSNATFWVKTDGAPSLYIYYGNSNVITTSNAINTFIFYDAFDTNQGWVAVNQSASFKFRISTANSRVEGNTCRDYDTRLYYNLTGLIPTNFTAQYSIYLVAVSTPAGPWTDFGFSKTNPATFSDIPLNSLLFRIYKGNLVPPTLRAVGKNSTGAPTTISSEGSGTISTGTWYTSLIEKYGTGVTLRIWDSSHNYSSPNQKTVLGNVDADTYNFFRLCNLDTGSGTSHTMSIYFDTLRITKYAVPEPSWSSFGDVQLGNPNWYDNNWKYCKKITIDHTKVADNLTNFPMLIKTTMNTSKVQNTGNDILFTSSDGIKLNHEIESYDSITGELIAWVNVTYIAGGSATLDTCIYIYYGNSACSSQQNITSTWDSGYVGVYHISEGGTGTRYDSTANAKDLTPQNYDGNEATTDGKMGGADNFSGEHTITPEYLKGADNSYYLNTAAGTLSAWVFVPTAGIDYGTVISKQPYANRGTRLAIRENGGLDHMYYKGTWLVSESVDWAIVNGKWNYVVGTRGASGNDVFINGVEVTYRSHYTGILAHEENAATGYLNVGELGSGIYEANSYYYSYSDKIDEARVSVVQRTPQWISTEYNNQNDPANFTIFSAEEQYTQAWGTKYGSPIQMQKNNQWQWSNFTWRNSDVAPGSVVGWRIYYNDTSGNANCTDIMSFRIGVNQPPMANFTWTPQNPERGEVISFNASNSYDPDGNIATYEWDWNNDGIYEESNTISTTSQSWTQADNYLVTLMVMDNNGTKTNITKTVNVYPSFEIPNVTTNDATEVETLNATLNGYLDYDGGENCDVRFEWGRTTDYGNVTVNQKLIRPTINNEIISEHRFDSSDFGEFTTILHASGEIYIIACKGADYHGQIYTLRIWNNGSIQQSNIDNWEFLAIYQAEPRAQLFHVADDVYGVTYLGNVKTFRVLDDGTIIPELSEYTFGGGGYTINFIVNVPGTTYYAVTSDDADFVVIQILDDGTINPTIISSYTLDDTAGPIVHVNNDVYAIFGENYLYTIRIWSNGTIQQSIIDSVYYAVGYGPRVAYISARGVYVVTGSSEVNPGGPFFSVNMKTVKILDDGSISAIDTYTFGDSNGANYNGVAEACNGFCVVGYLSGVSIVYINTNGTINHSLISTLLYSFNENIEIIHVSGSYYAIVHRGGEQYGGSGGYVDTVLIVNVPLTSGPFYADLRNLSIGTLYHYRAVANNSVGTSYGSDKAFLTKPYPLTSFTAKNYNSTRIDLNWTNSVGGAGAYIEYAVNSAPVSWNPGDGIKINDTGYVQGSSFQHTGLMVGTYYYTAWAYAEDSGVKSDGSAIKPFGDNPLTDNASVETGIKPVACIDEIYPIIATQDELISFVGHGAAGIIDDYLWRSDIDGEFGYKSTVYYKGFSLGSHNISFMVRNNYGVWSNPVFSTVQILPIGSLPDLAINSLMITFSDYSPLIGDNITINATVHNIGSKDAYNISISFFDNYYNGDILIQTLIGNTTIDYIPSQPASRTASIIWNITLNIPIDQYIGYHIIRVVVDPNNIIPETYERNNVADLPLVIRAEEGDSPAIMEMVLSSPESGFVKSKGEGFNVFGNALYKYPDWTLPVCGAEVVITINETGEQWTTWTSGSKIHGGEYSCIISAPKYPGNYHVTIKITDFTLTAYRYFNFTVVPGCPDLLIDYLRFDIQEPTTCDTVQISTRVFNRRDCNVTVCFYDIYQGIETELDCLTKDIPEDNSQIYTINWMPYEPGWHTIKVVVDPDKNIPECNEYNNWIYKKIFVWDCCPDFTPVELYFSEYTPHCARANDCDSAQGQKIYVTARIKNIGGISSGTWVDFVVQGDKNSVYVDNIPGKGGYKYVTASLRINYCGYNIITVSVNPNNETHVPECNEDNNNISRGLTAHSPLADLYLRNSDLIFTGYTGLGPIAGVESVWITQKVYNNNFEHHDPITGEYHEHLAEFCACNVDVAFTEYDPLEGWENIDNNIIIGPLCPGTSEIVSTLWNTTCEAKVTGWHTIKVQADPNNYESEVMENNNFVTKDIYIYPNCSDPTPTEISISGCGPMIMATIDNIGGLPAMNVFVNITDNGLSIYQGFIDIPAKHGRKQISFDYEFPDAGNHHLCIEIDQYDTIIEKDHNCNYTAGENNNYYCHSFNILPDLSIDNLGYFCISDPIQGDPIYINATIRNSGFYPIETGQSFNVTYFADASKIGYAILTGPIDPCDSKIATFIWNTTTVPQKVYTISVLADSENDIEELNENNNEETIEISIWSNLPDFAPISITFSDETPYGYRKTLNDDNSLRYQQSGQKITITAEIKNIGGASCGTWIKFADYYDGQEVNSTFAYIDNIPGKGGTKSVSASLRLNETGTHSIRIVCDPDDNVPEYNELNNNLSQNINAHKPLTDLYIKYYYRPYHSHPLEYIEEITFNNTNPIEGDIVNISTKVYNNNFERRNYQNWAYVEHIAEYPAFDAIVNFTEYDSIEGWEFIGTDTILFPDKLDPGRFDPGESAIVYVDWNTTNEGCHGIHTIKVVADPTNTIEEARKDNNYAEDNMYVWANLPELHPTNVWLTDDFPAQEIFTNVSTDIHTTIENSGGIDAAGFNVSFYDNGEFIGKITNVSCSGMMGSISLTIQDYLVSYAGPHIFRAIVDPDNDIFEKYEDNNIYDRNIFVHQPEPDLQVLSEDITFWINNTETISVEIGTNITIKAEVHNLGPVHAYDASIVFYVDLLERISPVMTIPYVPCLGSTIVETSWEVPSILAPGHHAIYVLIEPNIYAYDPNPDNNMASRAILISEINRPPNANNDSYETDEDVSLYIGAPGVLANDIDEDGDSLTAIRVIDVSHGVLTFFENGSFQYTPAANYHGTDSFTYRANDGAEYSNIATVTIIVNSINDKPIALDDNKMVLEDSSDNQINILANDLDIDGDNLTVISVTQPSHGTTSTDGIYCYYTPNPHWHGNDSFSYTIDDGHDSIETANVSITVISKQYNLTITIQGQGNVTKNPDYTSYIYGTVVNLTTNSPAGWSFDHWSGDASGTSSAISVMIDGNKSMTAYFTEDYYTLAIVVQGSGNVTLDPDQTTYRYGQIVTLTANPAAGWSYSHWSGDLNGSSNPAVIVMTGDKTVIVNFSQNWYSLSIGIDGQGNVTRNPDQPTYTYGQVVQLAAYPAIGWSFDHWSGDASGTSSAISVMIDGNKSIIANFSQDNYNLTITVQGSGNVTLDPDQTTYTYGQIVTLTANPAAGWSYSHWSGDLNGSSNPAVIVMTGDKTVIVNFSQNWYSLSIGIDGQGNVTRNPDQQTYTYGQVVQLAAYPAIGWSFDHWSGDASGTSSAISVMIDGNKSMTAYFTEDYYTLAIVVQGSGNVTLDPDQTTYTYGQIVTLTANPAAGWSYSHWSGDLNGSSNPAVIVMTGDKTVIVNFSQNWYSLSIGIDGQGNVTRNPDQQTYTYGQVVQLAAYPAIGWSFDHWSGDASGTSSAISVMIDGNKSIIANFSQDNYNLTITVQGSGNVTLDPDQTTYTYGQIVTLTANPAAGWSYSHWSGDLNGSSNPAVIVMTGDKTVIVNFSQNWYSLSIGIDGQGNVTRNPDQQTYTYGQVVQLAAYPAIGWSFDHWSGDASGTSSAISVMIDGNKSMTAYFTEDYYTLAIVVQGSGNVTLDPDQTTYTYGQIVTLTANPAAGWSYSHWSGDLNGSSNPAVIVMTGDKTVIVNFSQNWYSLSIGIDGQGNVTRNPDQQTYTYGQVVQLAAYPAIGWSFDHWGGDVSGGVNPVEISMTEDAVVTAYFSQNWYSLSIGIDGQGNVTRSPDQQTYTYGQVVQLAAYPAIGWSFDHWSGDASGTSSAISVMIDGNKSMTAYFTEDYYTLAIVVQGSGNVTLDPDQTTYTYGQIVTLTANPAAGWSYSHWSGDLNGSSNPAVIVMTGDKTVIVNFSQNWYSLSIGIDGQGNVTRNPDQPTYTYGQVVQLAAYPAIGWSFDHWGGDVSGGVNPVEISMTGDMNVTAFFTENHYTLDIAVQGSGNVTMDPIQTSYIYGQVVQISAAPATGWMFSHWSGDCNGSSNPTAITMTCDKSIMANFTITSGYTLTIVIQGSGNVTTNPNQPSYTYGQVVQISAAPVTGWMFSHWSGDLNGSSNPAVIVMTGDKTVIVNFSQNWYSLSIGIDGQGNVTRNPDQQTYTYGQVVQLAAYPAIGWSFDHWGGDVSGGVNPVEISMTEDAVVTAYFSQNWYSLSIGIDGQGNVTRNPDQQTYTYGQVVQLAAYPAIGWSFDHWSGDASGTSSAISVMIDGNKSMTAYFTEDYYTLAIVVQGSGNVTLDPDQTTYTYGQIVTLTANPAAGWSYSHWSGDLNGSSNPAVIVMTGDKTVIVNFSQNWYSLSIGIDGQGNVTRNPDQQTYTYGQVVQLAAYPAIGWSFDHWGGDVSGGVNPVEISMTGDMNVTAFFTENHYTLDIAVQGSGNVTMDPIQTSYIYGQVVQISAAPATGWMFSHWSGDCNGSSNPTAITMTCDKSIMANFTITSGYTLTIVIQGSGNVTTNPNQPSYTYGQIVTLTGIPSAEWSFNHWSGNIIGNNNPSTIFMNENKTVIANFTQIYAMWANSSQGDNTISCAGSSGEVIGNIHTNSGIKISGSKNRINGTIEYVTTNNIKSGNTYNTLKKTSSRPMPVHYDITAYQPGGSEAVKAQVQGKYHFIQGDLTKSNSNIVLNGLYYVTGKVILSGSQINGNVTIVSNGNIVISGSNSNFSAYSNGLLFFCNGSEFTTSGSQGSFTGIIYSPHGTISISGSRNTVLGGIFGNKITIAGSQWKITSKK